MAGKNALVIHTHPDQIKKIASLINRNYVAVIPYGKKERRVFALLGSAHSKTVITRMLKIKQRSASQALAISGIPEVAPRVAKLGETSGLVRSAKLQGKTTQQIINECFEIGAVGLVLVAQDWLPKEVTRVNGRGQRTVLIAGESTREDFDIFPKIYRCLMEDYGKVMVGTSANLRGEDTYHFFQQDEALAKMRKKVDLFVYDQTKIGTFPIFKHLTSTTMIDLTGEKPEVIRWGNIYPGRFRQVFPELIFDSSKLKKYRGRESFYHYILTNIFPFKGFLRT